RGDPSVVAMAGTEGEPPPGDHGALLVSQLGSSLAPGRHHRSAPRSGKGSAARGIRAGIAQLGFGPPSIPGVATGRFSPSAPSIPLFRHRLNLARPVSEGRRPSLPVPDGGGRLRPSARFAGRRRRVPRRGGRGSGGGRAVGHRVPALAF